MYAHLEGDDDTHKADSLIFTDYQVEGKGDYKGIVFHRNNLAEQKLLRTFFAS